ncbi:MAG: extracellular solute-binding protein [Anaerolineaceae bacterium]|nr:extracellular solute-binding protein [Anaerolineaceae bacterium]
MEDLIGKYIGRYHITARLGEGGMAVVYKAFDTKLERDVALKFIRSDMIAPALHEKMLKRFEREAKALAKFLHPNIVPVIDFGDFEGTPFLVMAYLPGGTLKRMTGKPMLTADAVRLLLPVARALHYAHQEKVVHRDVKPANILITKEGDPMLSDFGIAKILSMDDSTVLTQTGVGIGTPEYMAPEQWGGKPDNRTDVYALGVVFYELITGRRPYEADTPLAVMRKQLIDPLPNPRDLIPDMDETVEKVLIKALAKEPENRYENMDAFAKALEMLLHHPNQQEVITENSKMDVAPIDLDDETRAIEPIIKGEPELDSVDKHSPSGSVHQPEVEEVQDMKGSGNIILDEQYETVFDASTEETKEDEGKEAFSLDPLPYGYQEESKKKINPLVLGGFVVFLILSVLWIFGVFSPKEIEPIVEYFEVTAEPAKGDEVAEETGDVNGAVEVFSRDVVSEMNGRQALAVIFSETYPNVELTLNYPDSGIDYEQMLTSRLEAGESPDSWVEWLWTFNDRTSLEYMEPITWLYEQNGWMEQYPDSLIDLFSYDGEVYLVPSEVSRHNIIWYNPALIEAMGYDPDSLLDLMEWYEILYSMRDSGIEYPLIISEPWTVMFLLDSVLLAVNGPEYYSAFMRGEIDLSSGELRETLEFFRDILDLSNLGSREIPYTEVAGTIVNQEGAFFVMGDWMLEMFYEEDFQYFEDFQTEAMPGTGGTFLLEASGYAFSNRTENPEGVEAWLTLAGSAGGQDAYHRKSGYFPLNFSSDITQFGDYEGEVMREWKYSDVVTVGGSTNDWWWGEIYPLMDLYLESRDIEMFYQSILELCAAGVICH